MIEGMLNIAVVMLGMAMLPGFWRLAKGPTVVDRILAFDAVVLCAVGQVVLLSRLWESALYLDLVLIVSCLGFVSTVALVFYLQRSLPASGGEAGEDAK